MILVFGSTGQVATELRRLAPEATFLGRDKADLTDPDTCAAAIRTHAPSAVINAAAWTAVDKAEEEEATAIVVNGTAPGAMARACANLGIPFVHISTDYVFQGGGTAPWAPTDPTGPLGAYGRSKLAGEQAIQSAGGTWAILRTSWVFSAHGNNFVKTMLRLSETRDALNVVGDQIGGPTPACDIAEACLSIVDQLREVPAKTGLHHFSGAPDVSWADFARAIFDTAGRTVAVTDIPSSAYPTPAVRPANSRMNCASLETVFGISRPDWRIALAAVITELEEVA
ncbi:dTDP-4-dehydrorhamnose reductase [Flavimaricola sp.]|nr:dTDP-4-dehydrorhamnose reductase [Flavimaricola sp.]MDA9019762.1 dTDP-4-dehydrorhamnose reductase [Flavimaricola sp.]